MVTPFRSFDFADVTTDIQGREYFGRDLVTNQIPGRYLDGVAGHFGIP